MKRESSASFHDGARTQSTTQYSYFCRNFCRRSSASLRAMAPALVEQAGGTLRR